MIEELFIKIMEQVETLIFMQIMEALLKTEGLFKEKCLELYLLLLQINTEKIQLKHMEELLITDKMDLEEIYMSCTIMVATRIKEKILNSEKPLKNH
jgi:hypothetical protein